MELVPIVCEKTGELTGDCLPRHEAIAREAWCRTTNVFVMNSDGLVLCHQRSMQKERMPGMWMTHLGGHVGEGESYESNAMKELFEESGIQASTTDLISWRTTKIPQAHVWVREFVVLKDISPERLLPQPGEVDRFSWMSVDEIVKQQRECGDQWCAGTHDFYVEYHCLRAVLTAAQDMGRIHPTRSMHAWHPLAA